MTGRSKGTAGRTLKKRQPLGREAWLNTARQALIEEGTAGVEVNKLARRLGVSRGGFYWFFKHRRHLLDELLAFWAETSTFLFDRILQRGDGDGLREYQALIDLWIDEKDYDPRWDGAVRDWARTSTVVRKVVQSVDNRRIDVIERICRHLGYRGKDAHVRARVIYYHQVGYYALGIRETHKQRVGLIPFYRKVLTGVNP